MGWWAAVALLVWIAVSFALIWRATRVRMSSFVEANYDIFKRHGQVATRSAWWSALPSAARTAAEELDRLCTAIPARSRDVALLSNPADYLRTVCELVEGARCRIVVSALYLGSGPKSLEVVGALESTMKRWEATAEEGEIVLLFDRNRMHHGHNMQSLKRLLRTQADSAPHVVLRAFLFQTPSHWHRLCDGLPRRAREILGVQHTKVITVDDTTTILTGANLSDEYFTNRADRYFLFHRNEAMARWFSALVESLTTVSYGVRWSNGGVATLHPPSAGVDPERRVRAAAAAVRQTLRKFASTHSVRAENDRDKEAGGDIDTWVFPLLQYGRANVHHGSYVTHRLLARAWGPSMSVRITSPYLNTDPVYTHAILENHTTPFCVLTSSPTTNGFAGLSGFAGLIPSLYLQLERAFYHLLRLYGCGDRVRLMEYAAQGTYHAKGMWVGTEEAVCLTTVGSSNLGCRSVHKDIEADVAIATASKGLQATLAAEWASLAAGATTVDDARWRQSHARFQPVVALLSQLGRQYL